MNPRLVVSLFGALVVGVSAAVMAVAAGWGLLAGLLVYSGVGSAALLGFSVAWPAGRPARAKAAAGKTALAYPVAQRT